MAKQCAICGKKSMSAWRIIKLRGKYNPTIKKRKQPNLQWLTVPKETTKEPFKNFSGQRIKTCAKCIKTLHKQK